MNAHGLNPQSPVTYKLHHLHHFEAVDLLDFQTFNSCISNHVFYLGQFSLHVHSGTSPGPLTRLHRAACSHLGQSRPFQKTIPYVSARILAHSPASNMHSVEEEDENQKYQMHDTILVTRHDLPDSPRWTAHILEIRGHKPSNQVYLRVFWFYQPSELPPSLRHDYHGSRELLASNSMAVIDATAIVGRSPVSHWFEELESAPAAAGFFWRQTYDVQMQVLSVRTFF